MTQMTIDYERLNGLWVEARQYTMDAIMVLCPPKDNLMIEFEEPILRNFQYLFWKGEKLMAGTLMGLKTFNNLFARDLEIDYLDAASLSCIAKHLSEQKFNVLAIRPANVGRAKKIIKETPTGKISVFKMVDYNTEDYGSETLYYENLKNLCEKICEVGTVEETGKICYRFKKPVKVSYVEYVYGMGTIMASNLISEVWSFRNTYSGGCTGVVYMTTVEGKSIMPNRFTNQVELKTLIEEMK